MGTGGGNSSSSRGAVRIHVCGVLSAMPCTWEGPKCCSLVLFIPIITNHISQALTICQASKSFPWNITFSLITAFKAGSVVISTLQLGNQDMWTLCPRAHCKGCGRTPGVDPCLAAEANTVLAENTLWVPSFKASQRPTPPTHPHPPTK